MKNIKLLLLLILLLIFFAIIYLIIEPEQFTSFISIPNRSLPNPIEIKNENCKNVCNTNKCTAYINDNGNCLYTTTEITKDNIIFKKNDNPLYVKICDPITYTRPPTTTDPKYQPIYKALDIDCSSYKSYNFDECPILSRLCKQ